MIVADAHIEDITQIIVLGERFVTIGLDGFIKLWGLECEMLEEVEY
jgi:hypothetical protein